MQGPTVRHTITITIDNDLPYWDKDLYEMYGTLDLDQCVQIDAEAYGEEIHKFIASGSIFDHENPDIDIRSEVLTPAVP